MTALRGTKISYNKPKLYKTLGSLIKDYRQWRKLSQENVAGMIGVSVRQLRNWEANRRRIRIENLHDLSEVTGIPMQVCVALNADQPLWYCLQQRWFAYSSIIAQSLPNELLKNSEILDDGLILKKESITTDKHYNMLVSCHNDVYHAIKPLRKDTIEKASAILPELNNIIFDSWGHYVGHNIWLPLEEEVYHQLKSQKSFETYLTPERISEITTFKKGVLLYISSYISSLNVAYYILINAARYLVQLINRGKYIIAMYSALAETHEVSKALGMKVVDSHKHEKSEGYNNLYEVNLDFAMRPGGPWNWVLDEYKLKNNTNKGTLIADNNSGALIVDTYDRSHQQLGRHRYHEGLKVQPEKNRETDNTVCPNTSCQLYGEKGKGNIVANGTYRRKGEKAGHRFLCKKCGKSFCNRTGTMFYDLRSSEKDVLKALELLAEGKPLSYVKKELGVKFRTVRRWINAAYEQITSTASPHKNKLNLSEAEINALNNSIKETIIYQA